MVFIDTSIFVELLRVPGKSRHHQEIAQEFKRAQAELAQFVLPVTTIIETGNHIAQLASQGSARRACAQKFLNALEAALIRQPPWVLTGEAWDRPMVEAMVSGSTRRPDALTLMSQGIGTGDIGILAEIESYRRRIPSATPVRLWTRDRGLVESYT